VDYQVAYFSSSFQYVQFIAPDSLPFAIMGMSSIAL